VADVLSRDLATCDEWTEARWVASAEGLDCPRNVKELLLLALAAPASAEG